MPLTSQAGFPDSVTVATSSAGTKAMAVEFSETVTSIVCFACLRDHRFSLVVILQFREPANVKIYTYLRIVA